MAEVLTLAPFQRLSSVQAKIVNHFHRVGTSSTCMPCSRVPRYCILSEDLAVTLHLHLLSPRFLICRCGNQHCWKQKPRWSHYSLQNGPQQALQGSLHLWIQCPIPLQSLQILKACCMAQQLGDTQPKGSKVSHLAPSEDRLVSSWVARTALK